MISVNYVLWSIFFKKKSFQSFDWHCHNLRRSRHWRRCPSYLLSIVAAHDFPRYGTWLFSNSTCKKCAFLIVYSQNMVVSEHWQKEFLYTITSCHFPLFGKDLKSGIAHCNKILTIAFSSHRWPHPRVPAERRWGPGQSTASFDEGGVLFPVIVALMSYHPGNIRLCVAALNTLLLLTRDAGSPIYCS